MKMDDVSYVVCYKLEYVIEFAIRPSDTSAESIKIAHQTPPSVVYSRPEVPNRAKLCLMTCDPPQRRRRTRPRP